MKEKIKSAIAILQAENKHHYEYSIMGESLETAILSLKAWEEVLKELKLVISGCDLMLEDTDNPFYEGKKMGYLKAIDIINQKLAEIEKGGNE